MKKLLFGTLLAFVHWAQPVHAATTTGTLGVSITIAAECSIALSDMSFGVRGLNAKGNTGVVVNGNIALTCTKGTPYSVALDGGLHKISSSRRMYSQESNAYLTYELFRDSAKTMVWSDTPGSTYNGISDGNTSNLPVYGRLPAQTDGAPGFYTDSVSVTVTY